MVERLIWDQEALGSNPRFPTNEINEGGEIDVTILSFVLILVVLAVVVYGITLVFAGRWKELFWLAIGLVIAIIILQMLGIRLPNVPTIS